MTFWQMQYERSYGEKKSLIIGSNQKFFNLLELLNRQNPDTGI